MKASIESIKESFSKKNDKKFTATIDSIKDLALQIINENPNIPSEASFAIKNIQTPSFLINFVASNMNVNVTDKQKILSEMNTNLQFELSSLRDNELKLINNNKKMHKELINLRSNRVQNISNNIFS